MRALLLCMLTLVCVTAAEVENANVASMDVAPELRENEPFTAVVTVVNPHDRAVRIKQVDSTCSCTQIDLASHFLLPHGRTTLTAAVDNRNASGERSYTITLYPSDSELPAIDVALRWKVRPAIAVDALPPGSDPLARPTDESWRDVYRYVAHERPDEPNRLRKRIRLWSPANELPADGLKILGIDYDGAVWQFTPVTQSDGSILIVAKSQVKDPGKELAAGRWDEPVIIRTNHPDKPRIELDFVTILAMDAGTNPIDRPTLGK